MPSISFQPEWLNMLLFGRKRQTTRPLTGRYKVGDILYLYNQQRFAVVCKPVLPLTPAGIEMVKDRVDNPFYSYPSVVPDRDRPSYYGHFLGKVEVSDVSDICPSKMDRMDLDKWAIADGFSGFSTARCWFEIRYGARWIDRCWTVIKWDDWLERYFEPEVCDDSCSC